MAEGENAPATKKDLAELAARFDTKLDTMLSELEKTGYLSEYGIARRRF